MGCIQTKKRLCITYDIIKSQYYVCKCEIDSSNYHKIINEKIRKINRSYGGYYGFYDFPIEMIIPEDIYTSECLEKILLKKGYKIDNIKKILECIEFKEDMNYKNTFL
jgi:hypothetical protein